MVSHDQLLKSMAADRHAAIMSQRERYLEAWMAETGLKPSESLIVQKGNAMVGSTYSVVARDSENHRDEVKALMDKECRETIEENVVLKHKVQFLKFVLGTICVVWIVGLVLSVLAI